MITAIYTTVIISPYAMLGRAYMKENLKEIWIPEPYNLCVNNHQDNLHVFHSSKCRGAKSRSTSIQIPKSFADLCLQNCQSKEAIRKHLYRVFNEEPPEPTLHIDHGEAVHRRYIKAHPGQLKSDQWVGVIEDEDKVHIYNNYQDAVKDLRVKAKGQNYYVSDQHVPGDNDDPDEPEFPRITYTEASNMNFS